MKKSFRKNFLKFILVIGDVVLMYLALLLTLALRYGDFTFWPGPQTRVFLFHFSFISGFWLLFLFLLDFYEIPPLKKLFDFFYSLIVFVILAGATATIYFYLQPQPQITPKTILALDVFIFSLFLIGWRYLFSEILKFLKVREKIIMIGNLRDLSKEKIEKSGFDLVANFDSDSLDVSKLKQKAEEANSIIFDLDFHQRRDLVENIFRNLPLRLNFISFPDFYEEVTKKVPIGAIDKIWFLEELSRSERKVDQFLKRSFDILFSSFGLLVTGFLFPFIALAIKLDSPGSVFYPQQRVGKDRNIFTLYKFRTMRETPDQDEKAWREKEGDQIIRAGKFLRKTHLDELPQFWSILKGDLSFVGPRPEWVKLAEAFEKEIPFYPQRYLVKPGFTGWAQINFPPSTSVKEAKEKFEYDLYYIKNRSFLLDLGIILKTIRIVFKT